MQTSHDTADSVGIPSDLLKSQYMRNGHVNVPRCRNRVLYDIDTVAALDATQYIAVMAMMITHKSKLRMMNAIARDIT